MFFQFLSFPSAEKNMVPAIPSVFCACFQHTHSPEHSCVLPGEATVAVRISSVLPLSSVSPPSVSEQLGWVNVWGLKWLDMIFFQIWYWYVIHSNTNIVSVSFFRFWVYPVVFRKTYLFLSFCYIRQVSIWGKPFMPQQLSDCLWGNVLLLSVGFPLPQGTTEGPVGQFDASSLQRDTWFG